MSIRGLVIAATAAGILAGPAGALTFNFTTKAGDTLTASEAAAFTAAAAAWSSVLSDPFTVNLQIGFASLGSGILGQTAPVFLSGSYTVVASLLTADEKTANDMTAVASLPASPSGNLTVTKAQAKALGVAQTGFDGTIEFSSNYTFSDARDSNGNVAAGTYDLIGIAEHEIGHVLGFQSSIDGGTSNPSLLDQFRYSGANTRSVTAGANAYFSINSGVTDIANFSVGGTGNYQASHWAFGTGGVMDPTFTPGVARSITALDVEALDVIGYDAIQAVAEPASMTVLLAGLAGAVFGRRRRKLGGQAAAR